MKRFKKMDKEKRTIVFLLAALAGILLFLILVLFLPSKQSQTDANASDESLNQSIERSREDGISSENSVLLESSTDNRTWQSDAELEQEIFQKINQYRADHDRMALSWGNGEAAIAQEQCALITRENKTTNLQRDSELSCYFSQENPLCIDEIMD